MDISQKSSSHRDYSIHEILVIFSVQILFWHAVCVNDGTLMYELVLKSSCDPTERKAKVQHSRVHNASWDISMSLGIISGRPLISMT